MSICGNCGQEGSRIRSVFTESGEARDECPSCCPQSFDKHTAPSDKKIWIGPEYAPNDYEKRYDSDGVYYMPKPEVTAERERRLFVDTDEEAKYAAALEKKRREGRKTPMTPQELEHALKRAEELVRPMIEDPDTTYIV